MLHSVVRLVAAPLARFVYRPVVEGRENVPKCGPVILASNHLSFIDSVVIPLVAPRPVVFLAKAEYFRKDGVKGRMMAAVFTALGAVPVERGTHRAAKDSLELARRILSDGKAFGIYPEGSRSRDGRLYRGRTGVAWLAFSTGAPVVPVALVGTDRIQPIGVRLPRIKRITVRFGEPLRPAYPSSSLPVAQARRVATDEIMSAIQALSGQESMACYSEIASAA
ncbi:1-acyl-sn-glycerol-3-phosphate acyltransferase [Streptomyces seoulensis]|uniref:1-acyl-sn-glycerol-3-phosphate acyltransferase n=1 Tax=Streptomyces seoulensis TaxID=73044 RepID=A0A4P6U289_STRSO|nr:lysophospholipid acyltransferase family protein [Streptomyces seoulensis]QBJ94129.1 1-acyl-sn-glycerol-3-phosphate acyltransferase [Streptomyces seoulensis]